MTISEEDYETLGSMLELKGMTHSDIDAYFLEHHGIKGMRWGVRKNSNRIPGVDGKTNRMAAKDAHEFARAKQFYGDGAGTRRKLINAKVEQRSKNSHSYKRAFDHHLANQDMSKHSDKAVAERHRKDRTTKNKQRAGAIARRFTGEMGTQAAFATAGLAGVAYFRSEHGKSTLRRAHSYVQSQQANHARKQGAKFISDILKNHSA